MRPRYSFSSRRNRHIDKIKKQKSKYSELHEKIIESSDIILEILDARFPEETRNLEIEEEIKKRKKILVYVLNKSDLVINKKTYGYKNLTPKILVSCKDRKGIKNLRDLIKKLSKKIPLEENKKVFVGVIGYPNTGKSSLLNILIGKSSAGVGSEAGFTKGIQKIKLTENIVLIDSPGVIPKEKYSQEQKDKISEQTIAGGRSYTQVKDPELVVQSIMEKYPEILEKYYKINANGNSEYLIEKLGKSRGFLKKGGFVDEDKTARLILKDWQKGNIKI
ncbi:MAG: GTPase [Candidatus Pacearchaeota archaeon]|jgi:hypothetical protein